MHPVSLILACAAVHVLAVTVHIDGTHVLIGYRSVHPKQAERYIAAKTLTDDPNVGEMQMGSGIYTTPNPGGWDADPRLWHCAIYAREDALDSITKAKLPLDLSWSFDEEIDNYIRRLDGTWDPRKTLRISLLDDSEGLQMTIPHELLNSQGGDLDIKVECARDLNTLPSAVVDYDKWKNIKGEIIIPLHKAALEALPVLREAEVKMRQVADELWDTILNIKSSDKDGFISPTTPPEELLDQAITELEKSKSGMKTMANAFASIDHLKDSYDKAWLCYSSAKIDMVDIRAMALEIPIHLKLKAIEQAQKKLAERPNKDSFDSIARAINTDAKTIQELADEAIEQLQKSRRYAERVKVLREKVRDRRIEPKLGAQVASDALGIIWPWRPEGEATIFKALEDEWDGIQQPTLEKVDDHDDQIHRLAKVGQSAAERARRTVERAQRLEIETKGEGEKEEQIRKPEKAEEGKQKNQKQDFVNHEEVEEKERLIEEAQKLEAKAPGGSFLHQATAGISGIFIGASLGKLTAAAKAGAAASQLQLATLVGQVAGIGTYIVGSSGSGVAASEVFRPFLAREPQVTEEEVQEVLKPILEDIHIEEILRQLPREPKHIVGYDGLVELARRDKTEPANSDAASQRRKRLLAQALRPVIMRTVKSAWEAGLQEADEVVRAARKGARG